ncbi:MAG: hypothetical protein JWN31_518 [Frankiales bacterium]|nr:hypothetical protein [Frankiales bacterium]
MPNTTMSDLWNGPLGDPWVSRADRYDGMLTDLGLLALDAADLKPGESVLDIGCGSGQLSRQAAARVAPGGRVTGLDISAPLIALAEQRSPGPAASYLVGDAQDLALDEGAYDVVVSRFGVMFFEDPVAAFSNLRRATAPGGRLAVVVWQAAVLNPWIMTTLGAFAPHLTMPEPPPPGAPGPFAFGDEAHLRAGLGRAGWKGVSVSPVETTVLSGGPGTLDDAMEFSTGDGFAKGMLAGGTPEAQAAATTALRQAFEAQLTDEGVRLGAAVFVVKASRS